MYVLPGENRHPVSLMTDEQSEELACPVLFPKWGLGYAQFIMEQKQDLIASILLCKKCMGRPCNLI